MTAEPMKNCPFCGNPAPRIVLHSGIGGKDWHYIKCDNCDIVMQSKPSKEEVIAAWNNRVGEPIGNSEELPEWFVKQLKDQLSYAEDEHSNATYGAPMIAEHIRLLKWVLSLKKPEPE